MIKTFIKSLKSFPGADEIFNPWWEIDPENDIDDKGPIIRRQQLFQYLNERIGKAKYLLIAEAIGYQGGHFTGIPMTSERILLGGHVKKGILPGHVFSKIEPKRTSRPDLKPNGFSKPTATIVWGHIILLISQLKRLGSASNMALDSNTPILGTLTYKFKQARVPYPQ